MYITKHGDTRTRTQTLRMSFVTDDDVIFTSI